MMRYENMLLNFLKEEDQEMSQRLIKNKELDQFLKLKAEEAEGYLQNLTDSGMPVYNSWLVAPHNRG